MDDISGFEIAEEVVEFADGGVDVPAELEGFFEEAERR